jgi:hypothetical protein
MYISFIIKKISLEQNLMAVGTKLKLFLNDDKNTQPDKQN